MLSSRRVRLGLSWLLLAALAGLSWLALVAFRQALAAGAGEALMTAWVLAFVVALPAAMGLVAVARWWQAQASERRIVPFTGEKIPGAGQ